MKLFAIVLTAFLFAGNCSDAQRTSLSENEIQTTGNNSPAENDTAGAVKFKVETVAANLEVPWGFAFLPDGNMLFTERPGRVRLIENGKLKAGKYLQSSRCRAFERKRSDGYFDSSEFCRKQICLSRLRLQSGRQARQSRPLQI